MSSLQIAYAKKYKAYWPTKKLYCFRICQKNRIKQKTIVKLSIIFIDFAYLYHLVNIVNLIIKH